MPAAQGNLLKHRGLPVDRAAEFLVALRAVWRFVKRTFFSDYRQIMQSEMTWPITISSCSLTTGVLRMA